MEAHQLAWKLYLVDGTEVEADVVVRTFHRWIQGRRLRDLLIDVSDYTHVHQGPGVLLVAHEGQYTLDDGDGRRGLSYARKRPLAGDLPARLRATLGAALDAAGLLEEDLGVRFRTDELRFAVHDRLRAPRAPETWDAVAPALGETLATLFGGTVELAPTGEEREPFAVAIRAPSDPGVAALRARLDA